ncbi:MAG: sugar transferase [Candidatus Edwardsbacteria bacterium]
MIELSIIIVNYNSKDFLFNCPTSIYHSEVTFPFEVIVIDNASTDGSEKAVFSFTTSPFPRPELTRNPKNFGLAKANNQGIKIAQGRYLLFLNPDITLAPKELQKLMDFARKHPEAGVIGPRLLNPDGSLQYSCRQFYTLLTLLLRRSILGKIPPGKNLIQRHLMMDWDHQSLREVDWILGACLLVTREAIKKTGMMDERFFLYFEDVDWCYRMRKNGWKVFYFPEAEIIHYHQRQSAKGLKEAWQAHIGSVLKFIAKYGGLIGRRRDFLISSATTEKLWAKKHWSEIFSGLTVLTDLVTITIIFWLSYLLRLFLTTAPSFDFQRYGPLYLKTLFTVMVVLLLFGSYRHSSRKPVYQQLLSALQGVLFSTFCLLAFLFMTRGLIYSRLFLSLFWFLLIVGMSLNRSLLYKFNLSMLEKGYGKKRILIWGESEVSLELLERFLQNPELGYEVVGFLGSGKGNKTYGGLPVFPETFLNEKNFLRERKVMQILVPGLQTKKEEYQRFIPQCKEAGVDLRLVSPVIDLLFPQARTFEIASFSLVREQLPLSKTQNIWLKRIIDLTISLLTLLLLSPVILLLTLFHLFSGKPICVKEARVGKGRRKFFVYRFASPPGRNLFQLFNILKGDLSLVGVSPLTENISTKEEWQDKRFEALPGLTGFWRLVRKSNLSEKEVALLDLYYLEHWSPILDFEILLKTIPILFTGIFATDKSSYNSDLGL